MAVLENRHDRQDLGEAVPHRNKGRFAGICILSGRLWMTTNSKNAMTKQDNRVNNLLVVITDDVGMDI